MGDYVPCTINHPGQTTIICTSYLTRATSNTAWHSGIQLPNGDPYVNLTMLPEGPYAKKLKLNSAVRVPVPGDPSPKPRGISFTFTSTVPLGPCPPDINLPCVFNDAVTFRVRYKKTVK